ncbi:MAG: PQQ-dependent sugar dehydrogenase [Phycisphaerae bacterium]|nr:PQQ-dependent sugar dehydrogenase [Phycisphaerae bacterium]
MKVQRLGIAVVVGAAVILGTSATVEADSHDVGWTFGNVSSSSYRLDAFEPGDAELGASLGTQDPTLTLQIGKRYQVTVTNFIPHPLEVLAKGASAGADTILLAQGPKTGPFESDPEVVWQDNGAGTVTFTLTSGLHDAMLAAGHVPGYRCGAHIFTMRGGFNVLPAAEPEPDPLGDPIPEPLLKGDITVELEVVASGLTSPVYLTHAGEGTDRLFIVDQPGLIWIMENGQLLDTPFLDVIDRVHMPGFFGSLDVNDFDERGLLGLAFHPGFGDPASPGYQTLYTYTSEMADMPADFTTEPLPADVLFDHQSVITEWTVDAAMPNMVDLSTRREIMRIDEPQFNHDGGMLGFGRDGYLYISVGDGGSADDVADGHGATGNGQNKNTVHGSILRINPLDPVLTPDSLDAVSANGTYRVPGDNPFVGKDGVNEIFAYGFRNPWRFSFHPSTGTLVVADVGQNMVEEIDLVLAGGNYGWNLKEGTFHFDPTEGTVSDDLTGLPAGLIDPVGQYDHDEGISITGGFVYHGSVIPELMGKYVFGDFSSSFFAADGRLLYADLGTGLIREFKIGISDRDLGLYVKAFGQDAAGELYLLAGTNLGPFGTGGVVLKIVDLCTARIPGDLNNDCVVDDADLAILNEHWLESARRQP